jgi:subtilase family serine protease
LPIGRIGLEAAGDWTRPLTWSGLASGTYPLVAVVDPDAAISESNEANNQLAGLVMVARARYYLPVGLRR